MVPPITNRKTEKKVSIIFGIFGFFFEVFSPFSRTGRFGLSNRAKNSSKPGFITKTGFLRGPSEGKFAGFWSQCYRSAESESSNFPNKK